MTELSVERCHGDLPSPTSFKSSGSPIITKVTSFLQRYCVPLVLATYIIADRSGLLRSSLFNRHCICPEGPRATPKLAELTDVLSNPSDLTVIPFWSVAASPDGLTGQTSADDFVVVAANETYKILRRLPEDPADISGSRRQLSGGSGASSENSSHPHEALFFIVGAIIVGTAVTHACEHPLFHGVQQCVVLFVLGVIVSWVLEGASVSEEIGVFGRSYQMWMEIDPHLLLFTMLPPLVTGDAMVIDTSVAKRVYKQCLFLAGPGVGISAFTTALFLKVYLPYGWSFLLCLVSGSILCATDPVAVVALLKELGASPTLTVQIQGESLLNDGTAIVLYTIAYNMLKGVKYDTADVLSFLIKMAVYAWGLGMLIGYLFYQLIKSANNQHFHHSCIVQVSLTICSAYTSFIVAEGIFKISGVLSSVAAALVLAHKMWPKVANKESMETVWHMLEYLGNTVIFFLAGALTGKVMTKIQPIDYLHLLVIYLAITVFRAMLFFTSRPLLGYLDANKAAVSYADCCVMSWGGLRGAIGLALAIQVNVDTENTEVNQENKDRVLFYVSGVAALTLVVNATTCPTLVQRLGITKMPDVKRSMLAVINRQLLELTVQKTGPGRVRDAIRTILGEIEQHVIKKPMTRGEIAKETMNKARKTMVNHAKQPMATFFGGAKKVSQTPHKPSIGRMISLDVLEPTTSYEAVAGSVQAMKNMAKNLSAKVTTMGGGKVEAFKSVEVGGKQYYVEPKSGLIHQAGPSIVKELEEAKERHDTLSSADKQTLKRLGEIPGLPFNDQEENMKLLVRKGTPDPQVARYMCESFLAVVRAQYWHLIELGNFFDSEADKVLESVTLALSQRHCDLNDFFFISVFVEASFEESNGRMSFAQSQKSRMSAAVSNAKQSMKRVSQAMGLSEKSTQLGTQSMALKATASKAVSAKGSAKSQARLTRCEKTNQLKVVDASTSLLAKFLESTAFCGTMALVIIANAVCVMVENEVNKEGDPPTLPWLILEIVFTVVFSMEFALKFCEKRLAYFYSGWNVFDFLLVLLGIIGCAFANIQYHSQGGGDSDLNKADVSSEARMARTGQVFKILRLIRLLRLWRLWVVFLGKLRSAKVDFHVAEHMAKTTILSSFIKAHVQAQFKMVEFFGRRGIIDTVELARVIMQSRVAVYKALVLCELESHFLDHQLITHVLHTQESRAAARECEKFVVGAKKGGVITQREAEGLLEPIHEFMHQFMESLRKIHCGRVGEQRREPLATEEEAPILPEPDDSTEDPYDAKTPLVGAAASMDGYADVEFMPMRSDMPAEDLDDVQMLMPQESIQEPRMSQPDIKMMPTDTDGTPKVGKETKKAVRRKKKTLTKGTTKDIKANSGTPVPSPVVIGVDTPADDALKETSNELALLLDSDQQSGKTSTDQPEDTDAFGEMPSSTKSQRKWHKKAMKSKSQLPIDAPTDAL